MLKSFRTSLTLRIFLITSALLIAVCAITYGTIAYLTPITFEAILADELNAKSLNLIATLEKTAPEDGAALIAAFASETGAMVTAIDEWGDVLFDNAPAQDTAYAISEGASAEVTEDSAASNDVDTASPASDLSAENAANVVQDVTVVQSYASEGTGGEYSFTFLDGTRASLSVQGGTRAVNQAVDALGRVLPFLVVVILLISLAASFFYARFITRPIVSISDIARRMAALDFDARWDARRMDEIGALGDSLNHLSDNLSQSLTKLEDANRALKRDIDRERELDRQRMAFFSAASHELKTPITILKGQLSGMLAQVGIYKDREKYLARALEVTGRMEGLVKEILTINRIGSGGFQVEKKVVDLGEMMKSQLELDQELIEQKKLTLDVSIAENARAAGDESLLGKVIDNVLVNAILYSPPGATIFVEVKDNAFSVENTGASIPSEALSQLFTPFYRVEQSRNRKSGGSGLGLYLVKSILDLHSASCSVENTARGVKFSARL